MKYTTTLDGSPINGAMVAASSKELAQWIGKTFPVETLPDGSQRSITKNRDNRPLQPPTCTELGEPLGTVGYMTTLPPNPLPVADDYADLRLGKDTMADRLTVAALCEMERGCYC